ncbi:hypothetical protein [Polaromonas sp.]|uniref:hypothetical protein n=1 Tax=Polaromonas sp. TaxID=1869339 RepID=UPI0027310F27|nr:hypothetical protein [Polaromonas sp.]MDP1740804.1 hypothetical protein [Polaromonas sp.]
MTRTDFAKASIDDCQLTIRALDVKCGAILVLLLAPLTGAGSIFDSLESIEPRGCGYFLGALFFGTWAVSLLSLIRGLAPLDNPSLHILDHKNFTGTFYRGGLFNFGYSDALLRRSVIASLKKVSDAVAELPKNDAEILNELTFEHMKLCYIREVKIRLLRWGIGFAEVWVLTGCVIYLFARYGS